MHKLLQVAKHVRRAGAGGGALLRPHPLEAAGAAAGRERGAEDDRDGPGRICKLNRPAAIAHNDGPLT
jgi:hypothetical protein